jgi:heat shock transcription factor, other eukaryote
MQTWQLLEDPNNTHLISWTDAGDAFVVHQPDVFARELLPTVFKHNNYTSFVRQLNIYVRPAQPNLRER